MQRPTRPRTTDPQIFQSSDQKSDALTTTPSRPYRPLSLGGHVESRGNKKLCFRTASLGQTRIQSFLFSWDSTWPRCDKGLWSGIFFKGLEIRLNSTDLGEVEGVSALHLLKSIPCSTESVNLLMGITNQNLGTTLSEKNVWGSYG